MPQGVVHWNDMPDPPVVPGNYQVRMSFGEWSQTRRLKVEGNPNYPTTAAEYRKQADLLKEIAAKVEELFDGLTKLRDVKAQTKSIVERLKKAGMEDEAIEHYENYLDGYIIKTLPGGSKLMVELQNMHWNVPEAHSNSTGEGYTELPSGQRIYDQEKLKVKPEDITSNTSDVIGESNVTGSSGGHGGHP